MNKTVFIPKNTLPAAAEVATTCSNTSGFRQQHAIGGVAPYLSTASPPSANEDSMSSVKSDASTDTATAAASSITAPTSTEDAKYTIADTKHLVGILLRASTPDNVSVEVPAFSTLPTHNEQERQEATVINKAAFALRPRKCERGHLSIAMEIMDEMETEIDESEIISNAMDIMDLQEDNNDVGVSDDPNLLEQSLSSLLQPKKKESHYFSIAKDILRDFDEEDDEELMY